MMDKEGVNERGNNGVRKNEWQEGTVKNGSRK